MTSQPKYVRFEHHDGHYVLALFDAEMQPAGYGYRGPTLKRAQADLKYWTREKGLEELPADGVRP